MNYNLTFDFLNTPQIIFGCGRFDELGKIIESFGKRILLVASNSALKHKIVDKEIMIINDQYDYSIEISILKGEPDTEQIDKCIEIGLKNKSELIIGLGGGSVIDAGKAVAGLISNGGNSKDYMEVIGKGRKITKEALPYIAIPTTAGTGSEVTKNAVILSKEDKLKSSIRSPLLVPKIALIDPELMTTIPKEITASTGLDALTQLIEAYTSNKSQPITDELARIGIKRAAGSLIFAYENGDDISAREDMAFAALLSGICLANAGLGAIHGFAGPIGGMYGIPHGIICGTLLKPVIEENIRLMLSQVPFHRSLTKYSEINHLLGGIQPDGIKDAANQLIEKLNKLSKKLNIPKLSKYNLKEDSFESIILKAKKSSSMKYNPIELSDE
ncbi:MAG: iron-containing alcohol dehydrogenase, partial [Asgard group archaeon]|nr:iron-containing alcohol dehydrogenase [Asgard group archaeon]